MYADMSKLVSTIPQDTVFGMHWQQDGVLCVFVRQRCTAVVCHTGYMSCTYSVLVLSDQVLANRAGADALCRYQIDFWVLMLMGIAHGWLLFVDKLSAHCG